MTRVQVSPMFQGNQQHDSQELLLLLIDCLIDSVTYAAAADQRASSPAAAAASTSRSPCADVFSGATCGNAKHNSALCTYRCYCLSVVFVTS
jgi:hypothetical protein